MTITIINKNDNPHIRVISNVKCFATFEEYIDLVYKDATQERFTVLPKTVVQVIED